MTPERWTQAKELYFALASMPALERAGELDRRCAADPEMRAALARLLSPAPMPAGFMEEPALGPSFDAAQVIDRPEPPDPAIGLRLGPYRIESRIGAGGMGAVYLAARADGQFEQRVAIKLVKRGLDSDDILRRFHLERQVLANLHHPNIAALLDGGATPDGRPFLVMEHVQGRPIDLYCEEQGLTVEQRLELFCTVCGAVHSAHQNLVVHRDLKPGNILVRADGAPKLLDFGIAKVLEPDRAQVPEVTAGERRLLTPGFASPEQVLGRPVSTASDVYSLGVVLYHVLTGEPPYRFESGTDEELRRLVCETDPAPPGETARRRRAASGPGPDDLPRRLRGDLDRIVLMAMRKEPERRYASAEQFAADIRRHLDGHPVLARPDTFGYRACKFVKRNALAVSAAAAVGVALGAGVLGVAWQAQVARAQRDSALVAHAEADQINEFLQSILQSANAFGGPGRDVTVRELLEGAADRARAGLGAHPVVLASALGAIGSAYTSLGLYDEAGPLLRQSVDIARTLPQDAADLPARLNDLATLLYATGGLEEAERLIRESLEIETARSGGSGAGAARTLNNLGAVLRAQGRLDEAESALREALTTRRALPDPDPLAVAETLNNLANILRLRQDLAAAEVMLEESLEIRERALGEGHPLVAQSLSNLAVLVHGRGELERAAPLYERALALQRAALGPEHPDRASTLYSYGRLLRTRGDPGAAEAVLRESLAVRERLLAPNDPRLLRTRVELGACLSALARHEEAIATLRAAREAGAGLDPEMEAYLRDALGAAYDAAGRPEEAARERGAAPP